MYNHPFFPVQATSDGRLYLIKKMGSSIQLKVSKSHPSICEDSRQHGCSDCPFVIYIVRFYMWGHLLKLDAARLVIECHDYYVPTKTIVASHIDGNRKNNAITNLKWCYI
jgi:hypothetical protein